VKERRIDQFKASIDKALEQSDLSIYGNIVEDFIKEREISPEQVAAALAFMAQQDRPLNMPENTKPERRDPRDAKPGFNEDDRPRRKERKQEEFSGEAIAMERFRIEVGHEHQVKPGDIVGAIANEADLSSAYIGRISLFDDHSTVDLPAGMPPEMLQMLKKVRVRSQPLNISSQGAAEDFTPGAKPQRPRRGNDRPRRRR
jgi:ATP-dependent RNA helicase DeaD